VVIERRFWVVFVLAFALPVSAQTVNAKVRSSSVESSACGEVALNESGNGKVLVVNPTTGGTREVEYLDAGIGRWESLYDGVRPSSILFSPNGESWVDGQIVSVKGEKPRTFQDSFIYGPLVWVDDHTLLLAAADDRTKVFRWDVRDSSGPKRLSLSFPSQVAQFGVIAGRLVALVTPVKNGVKRAELIDLQTLKTSPAFRDRKPVIAAEIVGGRLLRSISVKGEFLLQEAVGNSLKTVFRSSSKNSIRFDIGGDRRASNMFNTGGGPDWPGLWFFFDDPSNRFVFVGTDVVRVGSKPSDAKSWAVDLVSGQQWDGELAPESGLSSAFRVQGAFVFAEVVVQFERFRPSRDIVLVTESGRRFTVSSKSSLIASYGPPCAGVSLAQRKDQPRPLFPSWSIRPVGSNRTCIGSTSSRALAIVGPTKTCVATALFIGRDPHPVVRWINPVYSGREGDEFAKQCVPAGTLVFEDCANVGQSVTDTNSLIWRTLDPVAGRSRFPNPQGTYPLWVELDGVAQCLTRSGDTDGSTVSMQPCGDVSPNQLWE
jgi:hypothetical protein